MRMQKDPDTHANAHPLPVSDRCYRAWGPRRRRPLPPSIPDQRGPTGVPLGEERSRPCLSLPPERAGVCAHPELANCVVPGVGHHQLSGPSALSSIRTPSCRVRKPQGRTAATWGRQANSTRMPPPAFHSMLSGASKRPQPHNVFLSSRTVPAPSCQAHSPGAPPPSPKHPALATRAARVFASERARAQRPGARGRSGTQCAQLGASGGLAAPAGHTLRPADAGVRSNHSLLRGARARDPGWPPPLAPRGPAGSPGRLGHQVRSSGSARRVRRKGEGRASEIKEGAGGPERSR